MDVHFGGVVDAGYSAISKLEAVFCFLTENNFTNALFPFFRARMETKPLKSVKCRWVVLSFSFVEIVPSYARK
jgi:hypothetical protein